MRWIIVSTTLAAGLWALLFGGMLATRTDPVLAALLAGGVLLGGAILGGLVNAGISWAMRGDRG